MQSSPKFFFERLTTERISYLAGGIGFSALSGTIFGIQTGLLIHCPEMGMISALPDLMVGTVCGATGISMYDVFSRGTFKKSQ